jgi:hypothetical protein
MRDHLECAKSQIKLVIRDLEREIGITESASVNLHLAGALDAIDRMTPAKEANRG